MKLRDKNRLELNNLHKMVFDIKNFKNFSLIQPIFSSIKHLEYEM